MDLSRRCADFRNPRAALSSRHYAPRESRRVYTDRCHIEQSSAGFAIPVMVMVATNFGVSNEPMVARPTGKMVGAATLKPPTSGQALCGGDTRPAASYQMALVGPTWENKPSRGASIVVVLLHVPEQDLKDTYKGEQEAVTP